MFQIAAYFEAVSWKFSVHTGRTLDKIRTTPKSNSDTILKYLTESNEIYTVVSKGRGSGWQRSREWSDINIRLMAHDSRAGACVLRLSVRVRTV